MSIFNPSRDEVREFFFNTWHKFKQNQLLEGVEKIAVQVMQSHPEYHAILGDATHYMQQQYFPEMGETNPFLHMSLHMSVLEQISINQPIGIATIYQQLIAKHQNELDAQHDLIDCLAETIWQAQRNQQPLDAENYLLLMQKKVKSS